MIMMNIHFNNSKKMKKSIKKKSRVLIFLRPKIIIKNHSKTFSWKRINQMDFNKFLLKIKLYRNNFMKTSTSILKK